MAQIRDSVVVRHPEFNVLASISGSHDDDINKHDGAYVHTATLVISTGACTVQCYATEQQLRQMAAMFSNLADAVSAVQAAEAA